jgi:preprotein translocase subunit SecE
VADTGKGGLVAGIRNIPTFINQVKAETGKVAWPSRRETVMTAVMVVVMTLLLGVFFFGVDWVFSRIVRELIALAS